MIEATAGTALAAEPAAAGGRACIAARPLRLSLMVPARTADDHGPDEKETRAGLPVLANG